MTRSRRVRPIGRVLRRRYRDYIQALRAGGATERTIDGCVRWMHGQERAIARRRCPDCGRPLVRYGATETASRRAASGLSVATSWQDALGPGGWVMYRCSSQKPPGEYDPGKPCGFMVDRFEAQEAN